MSAKATWSWGLVIFILVITNVSLFAGHPNHALVFDGQQVSGGEWWRVFTYPLAHVSLYHWVLDVSAFLILWGQWQNPSWGTRMIVLACCTGGSLLGAMAWAPDLWLYGLGGLSGVGHGLMAVVAMEQICQAEGDRRSRVVAAICLAVVLGKSMIEAGTGSIVLSELHRGALGVPIAACHLGGVLGGLAASIAMEKIAWKNFGSVARGGYA